MILLLSIKYPSYPIRVVQYAFKPSLHEPHTESLVQYSVHGDSDV